MKVETLIEQLQAVRDKKQEIIFFSFLKEEFEPSEEGQILSDENWASVVDDIESSDSDQPIVELIYLYVKPLYEEA